MKARNGLRSETLQIMKKQIVTAYHHICKRVFRSKSQTRYVILEIVMAVLVILAIAFLLFIS